MKRLILPAALVIALALPVGAAATDRFFGGPIQGGVNNAGVEFKARIRHGEPRKVLNFHWFNMSWSCGPLPADKADFTLKVNRHGKFGDRGKSAFYRYRVAIHGKFKSNRKAVGTLRVHTDTCDTGDADWKATHGGG